MWTHEQVLDKSIKENAKKPNFSLRNRQKSQKKNKREAAVLLYYNNYNSFMMNGFAI